MWVWIGREGGVGLGSCRDPGDQWLHHLQGCPDLIHSQQMEKELGGPCVVDFQRPDLKLESKLSSHIPLAGTQSEGLT